MLNALITALTLAALVSGLDSDGVEKKQVKTFISQQVDEMTKAQPKGAAPPIWYSCMTEIRSNNLIEREMMRLYNEEEAARMVEPDKLVKMAANSLCEDSFYEN